MIINREIRLAVLLPVFFVALDAYCYGICYHRKPSIEKLQKWKKVQCEDMHLNFVVVATEASRSLHTF